MSTRLHVCAAMVIALHCTCAIYSLRGNDERLLKYYCTARNDRDVHSKLQFTFATTCLDSNFNLYHPASEDRDVDQEQIITFQS